MHPITIPAIAPPEIAESSGFDALVAAVGVVVDVALVFLVAVVDIVRGTIR